MSNYGITGWSGGGRRPITNNLRAGQFRQMGVPRNASSNIFINNNFGCMGSYNGTYFDDCCGNNDDGLSKFEKWMMGIGIGGSLVSCILGAFGKGKSEGAGDTGETKTDEFAGLKELYKNEKYTFSKIDNDYCCNTGNGIIKAPSLKELNEKLMELKNKPTQQPATQTTQETPASTTTPAETETSHKLADFNWKNFDVTKLTDDKTSPLTMQAKNDTTVSGDHGSNVDAPKTITVSRNGKTYKFELIDDKSKISSEGHPMYKCTSNGKELSENQIQEYYLKPDGEFYQNDQTAGYGTALGRNLTSSTEGAGSSDETPTRTAKPAQSKPSSSAKPATAKPAAAKPASTTATQQATSSKPKMVATYNVTAKKGKYIVKKDSTGKYHYYSGANPNQELNEAYFQKQTGFKSGDDVVNAMKQQRADRADKAAHHTAGIKKEGRTVTITLDNGKTFTKRASGVRWNSGELNGLERELKEEIKNAGYANITYMN